jgi:hypothetical protein
MADRPKVRINRFATLLLGLLVGAILVSPAGAHVGTTIAHLWGAPGHIKAHVKEFSDGRYIRMGVNSYLPKGKTETGTVAGRTDVASSYVIEDVSFPMPLNFVPTVVLVDNDGATPKPTGCGGSFNSPTAAPGYVCVYAGFMSQGTNWDGFWNLADGGSCGCKRGVVVYKFNNTGYTEATGSWAVTAPTGTSAPAGASTPSRHAAGTGAQ